MAMESLLEGLVYCGLQFIAVPGYAEQINISALRLLEYAGSNSNAV